MNKIIYISLPISRIAMSWNDLRPDSVHGIPPCDTLQNKDQNQITPSGGQIVATLRENGQFDQFANLSVIAGKNYVTRNTKPLRYPPSGW
jgi:hypothetical protein